jgi:hypothetical protein
MKVIPETAHVAVSKLKGRILISLWYVNIIPDLEI